MYKVELTSGKTFDCPIGESILNAAENSGISLPYSCRKGRCSSCRCRILGGHSDSIISETGLTKEEKEQGWILSCARTPTTDILIDCEDLGQYFIPDVQTLPAKIHALEKLSSDVLHVVLRLPEKTQFEYLAGQYVDVIGPGGVRRSYSIANAPSSTNKFSLHIRAVDGGIMSEYWFKRAKIGELVRIKGPQGSFFLREFVGLDLVFLATGTGIAPVIAMLETIQNLTALQMPRSVSIFWGGRRPEDIYLDIAAISGQHHFEPVLSRDHSGWTGVKGYVQHALLDLKPDLKNACIYACGSDAMIQSAKKVALDAGLPKTRFYSDAFLSSAEI